MMIDKRISECGIRFAEWLPRRRLNSSFGVFGLEDILC